MEDIIKIARPTAQPFTLLLSLILLTPEKNTFPKYDEYSVDVLIPELDEFLKI